MRHPLKTLLTAALASERGRPGRGDKRWMGGCRGVGKNQAGFIHRVSSWLHVTIKMFVLFSISKVTTVRNWVLCAALLLCSSCAINHGRPIANLEYLGVDRYLDRNIYQVRFSSNVDITRLFKSKISQTLVCSFGDDLDFSVSHSMDSYGEGFVESIESSGESAFKADVLFFERKDSTSEKSINSEALKSRLSGHDFLTCRARINSYSYKVYLSEEMKLPATDLLREIEKL